MFAKKKFTFLLLGSIMVSYFITQPQIFGYLMSQIDPRSMPTAQSSTDLNHPPTTPMTPSANTSLTRGLLNVLLVFIESAITLVLRFDPKLRKLAYPLAEQDKVVCIRTYLPHTEVYATFGYRGVLLDDRLPPHKSTADIIINAYTFQVINVLTNHSSTSVDKLQIRGESDDVAQLKAFLVQLGVGGAIENLLQKLKGKPAPTPEQKAQKQQNDKIKIAEQAAKIDRLTMENKRLTIALTEMTGKQKSTKTALIITSVVALLAIISHFIW